MDVEVAVTVNAGVPVGVSVRADVRVDETVGTAVTDADDDGELEGVSVDEAVDAGVVELDAVGDEVWVGVGTGDPVVDAVPPSVSEGDPVCDGLGVLLPLEVAEEDDVADCVSGAVADEVADTVRAGVTVVAPVGLGEVLTDEVGEGVAVIVDAAVSDPEQDAHTGAVVYGAMVTPRNTVLVGAVARVVAMLFTVSKLYTFVGEVK